MNRKEIVEFIYNVIKCNGKTLNCIGRDCCLCMADRLADYINTNDNKEGE